MSGDITMQKSIIYVDASTTKLCFWFSEDDWHVEPIEKRTNNQAEYLAVYLALAEASRRGLRDVIIYSDSELVVKQLNGDYEIKNETLRDLAFQVNARRHCGICFSTVEFRWTPREFNPAGRILG